MDQYIVITTNHDYRDHRVERMTVSRTDERNAWVAAHQQFETEKADGAREDRTVVAVIQESQGWEVVTVLADIETEDREEFGEEAVSITPAARAAVERLLDIPLATSDSVGPDFSGDLVESRGEWDEDGFHLVLETDEDKMNLRVFSTDVARGLLREVNRLRPWLEDEARERAAYDSASQEERDEVLGRRPGDPDPGERMRESIDIIRKREKEDG